MLQVQLKHAQLSAAAGANVAIAHVHKMINGVFAQYASDDFDLLIVMVGWNQCPTLGEHPLKNCAFFIPPALLQERRLMSLPGQDPVPGGNFGVSFHVGAHPFIASSLNVIAGPVTPHKRVFAK